MKKHLIPIAFLAFLLASCDNSVVSKGEYDALQAEKQELQAENDSLHFELSSLKMYVDHLEEDNAELMEEQKRTPVNEE